MKFSSLTVFNFALTVLLGAIFNVYAKATPNAGDTSLSPLMGRYKLIENDKERPCFFDWKELVDKYGIKLDLRSAETKEPNGVEDPGEMGVYLEQYFDGIKKWDSLFFDKPQFYGVNAHAKKTHHRLGTQTVTHYSTWNPSKLALNHVSSVVQMPLLGGKVLMTEIQFSENKNGFIYSVYVEESSPFGDSTPIQLQNRCRFEKIPKGH